MFCLPAPMTDASGTPMAWFKISPPLLCPHNFVKTHSFDHKRPICVYVLKAKISWASWDLFSPTKWRIRWLDGVIDSMDMSLSQLWEIVKDREAWHASVRGVTKNWTWLSNLTKLCSYLSSILRRAHLFFLNIICSPLNCLHSPSPFAIKMI